MSVIGIDVGGTWIKAGRFSDGLELEQKEKVRSGAAGGKDAFFASIAEAISSVRDTVLTPVGIALPGPVSRDGSRIHYMANVSGMDQWNEDGIDIAAAVRDHGDVKYISSNNDVACAVLGEWQFGIPEGDPAARLLHVTWGTGIGTGFVSNGKSHFGWEGGHIPLTIEANGPTVESETKVGELLKRARDLITSGGTTSALDIEILSNPTEGSKHLVAIAERGDALAQQVLFEAATAMAHGLHVMALIAYPTVVTLGGGNSKDAWLVDAVRHEVERMSVGIRRSSLVGAMVHQAQLLNDAGIIGAAIHAQQSFK